MSLDPQAIDREAPCRRPAGRAVMHQTWRNLLFLHWSFPPATLRKLIPKELELDTFEGRAYVGLVPFLMANVRPSYLPAVPWLSYFPETNVRTYVHREGRDPGVLFFSLDAGNPIAVVLARALFYLPYYSSRMTVVKDPANGLIHYNSTRFWPPPVPASTSITCRPKGSPRPAALGTLDHFLIERYLLYTTHRGRLIRGQVHHHPYPVESASLEEFSETRLASNGLLRPGFDPMIHYSGEVSVEIFPVESLASHPL